MSNELIINATDQETRVALIEKGTVAELYVEREQDKGIVGNIYKGKVSRVLPGMQAAFVDIGQEKAAFLYAGDVFLSDQTTALSPDEIRLGGFDEGEEVDLMEEPIHQSADGQPMSEGGQEPPHQQMPDNRYRGRSRRVRRGPPPNIGELLKEGQEILVQVTKSPIGTKGARLTMHLSIPGRNLVLMPTFRYVGVSRRISSDKERRRLKEFIQSICPNDVGVIVRTACENKKSRIVKADFDYLLKIWRGVERDLNQVPAPACLHEELDIVLRTLRDMFVDDVDRIIIDSKKEHKQILRFLDIFNPALKRVVKFYKGREPIFDTYGVEMEINRALGRRVWLKSGGYIIVDQAEALTVIDVNTGRYVGKRDFEETILKINMEAAREIAYQLRLRNCGGIIIIDFIDMERSHHRERVYRSFDDALRKDRAKNSILKISELGLIEMTRKRTRESLLQTLCSPCFYCEGRGYLKSKGTICFEIFREIQKSHGDYNARIIDLLVHPDIAKLLEEEEIESIHRLEKMVNKRINIVPQNDFHIEQFEMKGVTQSDEPGATEPIVNEGSTDDVTINEDDIDDDEELNEVHDDDHRDDEDEPGEAEDESQKESNDESDESQDEPQDESNDESDESNDKSQDESQEENPEDNPEENDSEERR